MLAALLLAFVPAPQESAPLLAAPEGWQTERIPFPLDFAPELDFRGVEDLAFAPGMFTKGADGYFSYALAIELEGEHVIDAPFVEHFFTTYYRGLCKAVGESKQLTLDLEAVSAKAEGGADYFKVSVQAFDPFTDGGALALTLDVRTHARAGKTELAAIASPADKSAKIWKELRPILQAWQRARPAPVFLNHVYWVVDRATYEALKAEPFLRELAVVEERTTQRSDRSYTGLYLYGRRTYIEFLAADESAGFVAGQSGIALGIERAGWTDALAVELHRKGFPSSRQAITRAQGDAQVPWFAMLAFELPPGPLALFTLEYSTRFLGKWRPDLPAVPPTTSRAAVLARYAEALGQDAAKTLLGDVFALHVALDEAQRTRLYGVLGELGFEKTGGVEGGALLDGPGLRLLSSASPSAGGLTRCELALTREVRREPLTLGKVRLRFDGTRAEVEFLP
jgi:hypothetical protein